MKIRLFAGYIFLTLCFFFSIFLLNDAFALRKLALKAEVFKIPNFRSKIPNHSFNGIGIDFSTGNITLASDSGWCEIPYKNGEPVLPSAFIAPTKGFQLKAIAGGPGEVFVFDKLTGQIMGTKRKHKLPVAILNPAGMAYHNSRIFLADGGKSIIYELDITGAKAKVIRRLKAHKGICGLASDGKTLYSCSSNAIAEYDSEMRMIYLYRIDVHINGIACSSRREIIAVSKGKNEIYRFKIVR